MADRSDDIKQLFSHLGLNPGDYQEMRERTRALSRGTEGEVPEPAATRRAPEAPVTKAPAAAPQATAVPPTVRLNPLITRAPATGGGEATQRWPLLKAAVETPTRVAQRSEASPAPAAEAAPTVTPTPPPAQAAAPAPQPPVAEKTVAAAPVATPAKVLGSSNEVATLLKAVEQAKAMERAESDAIERTTRRVVDELQRSRVPTKAAEPAPVPVPTPTVAPTPAVAPQPAPAPAVAAAAVEPQAPKTKFFQRPVAAPAPVVPPAAPQPVQSVAAEPKAEPVAPAPSVVPGSELQSAFQRLVDPERVPQQRFSRLKFNYGTSEAPTKPKKLKEENLEDVFSRISGPPKSR